MPRSILLASALAFEACSGGAAPPSPEPAPSVGAASPVASPAPAPAVSDAPRGATASLELRASWPILAALIGVGNDGQQWIAAIDHELVVFEGDREVRRIAVMAQGQRAIAALPDGGWVTDAMILGPAGEVRFDAHAWGRQFGRYASMRAMAVSADGRVAIVAGSDWPSKCLRGCGDPGSFRGALARFEFDGDAKPVERRLIEHDDRRDFVVAASDRGVAAIEGLELSVWPTTGDGAPWTRELEAPALRTLAWAGDRLVGTRWVDTEHAELVVIATDDRDAPPITWKVEGTVEVLAVRPDGREIAIGTQWYRARATVEVDTKRLEIFGLDGQRHAGVELPSPPVGLAWNPRGDALLVATSGGSASTQRVLRFAAASRGG